VKLLAACIVHVKRIFVDGMINFMQFEIGDRFIFQVADRIHIIIGFIGMKNPDNLKVWDIDYFVIDQITDVPDIIYRGMHYHNAVFSGVNIFFVEEVLCRQLNAEKNKSN
jgi:hypothetical protein